MKLIQFILMLLISLTTYAQSDVPDEYWIDDSNFESKISERHAFGDDNNKPVVIEFWAKFNEANCFAEWKQLENAIYYRVNIAEAPEAKKKYRVRMAPTIIIFKNGVKEQVFKAGLDLLLPTNLEEIQEAINEINTASQF